MNTVANEIASYLGSAEMTEEEFLEHYGVPRRSGRYPWGSGKDPYQHSIDFLSRVEELKKKGWKETPENIMKEFGLSSTQYRWEKSICNDERRALQVATAKRLRDKEGMGPSAIGKEMGVRESTVRSWFNEESEAKMNKCKETADFLKSQIEEKRMIDVGPGAEIYLNVTRTKLDTALYMLEREGYNVYSNRIPQPTNKNQMTTQKVLCAKDIVAKEGQKVPKELYEYENIKPITDFISRDGGVTFEKKFTYPTSLDKKRLYIRYPDEGGADKDGIIELRRGVPDLDLQGSRYSQVRILVDEKSYLKGMAVYSDDMPDGVDVVFNTSKKRGSDEYTVVMKKIKSDPDNPFGSAIKDADQGGQYWYTDPKTGKKKLGLINKRADEGDWTEWADTLPSQFLAKQSKQLAQKQLNLAKANKEAEFDEIMQLNNPTLRKHYLDKFASSCDAAAVDLKAAALPGQKYHVIIPINNLTDKEIYAPQYKDGTKLALIRYPHGGLFEIPILTVNNKNQLAEKIIGPTSIDAVGINKKVADQLSGADFDGDTVMCIPTHDRKGNIRILNRDELPGLKGFDNKFSYGPDDNSPKIDDKGNKHYYRNGIEYKVMTKSQTNNEMGRISNLITDMTLAGADDDELAAAVRHSMVVIDAEKHKLDYNASYRENNIAALKKKYQPKYDENGNIVGAGGAATIISRSKGPQNVPKRKGQARINQKGKDWYDPSKPEGALLYTTADDKDLYFVVDKYDKKTGIKTITQTNGKKIEYNMYDAASKEKYDPIKKFNPKTGKYEPVYKKDPKTGVMYTTNTDGTLKYRVEERTIQSKRMAETDDAYTLVSTKKHTMEILYADYANHMKALANKARKEMVYTGNLEYDPNAKKVYKEEVASLNAKLNNALKNAAKERQAQRMATVDIMNKKALDPDMTNEDIKKLSQRSLSKYRTEVDAVSRRDRGVKISDKEWEAIQAGAISENKLKKILDNSDPDVLRERAMPKASSSLNTAQINRIKAMSASNFTLEQIAAKMNVSTATIAKYLKGAK